MSINTRTSKKKSINIITTILFLSVFSSFSYGEADVKSVEIKAIKHAPVPNFKRKSETLGYKEIKNKYIVQLKSLSLVQYIKQQLKVKGTEEKSIHNNWRQTKDKYDYQQTIANQQKQFINKVKSSQPTLQVFKQFDMLINGLAITADQQQIKAIAKLPEVSKIYPIHLYYTNLDRSHEVIRTNLAWEKLGGRSQAGKNIKIAIIDTGIRNTNPLFNDEGLSAPDFSNNEYFNAHPDYCRSAEGDAQFCNNKIIAARWINPEEHGMEIYEGEYKSPFDFNGHGSHVAGIASGASIQMTLDKESQNISGVAPASYLMVYKSLYVDPFGSTVGTDTMLLEALETAVKDGADIINNSWGSAGQVPEDSIFNEAITNAEALGVVVVNAAGNDLHAGGGYTINCPACIESGLAVANTTHGRFFGNKITIDDQTLMGYQGKNPSLFEDQELTLHAIDVYEGYNPDGCGSNFDENIFNGGVILAEYRYNCTFEEIAINFKKAGGDMVVLMPAGVFGMGTFEPLLPIYFGELAIPVLGVSRDSGLILAELAYTNRNVAHISADITRGVETQYSDKQHPFSSTGPNLSSYILKPDIAAPGTNILSAYSPDIFQVGLPPFGSAHQKQNVQAMSSGTNESTFALLTGTSMASPHIAGAAALLKQNNPEWNAKQIKSALTSTADTNVLLGYDQATAFGIGAGRVDVANAVDAQLTFSKVSFTDNACISQCSFTNQVQNTLDTSAQWQVEVIFEDSSTTGEVTIESLSLAAKGNDGAQMDFSLTIDSARSAIGEWVFGQVVFKQHGQVKHHLPIAIYTNDTTDSGILNVSASRNAQTDNSSLSVSPVSVSANIRNINIPDNESLTLNLPTPVNTSFITGSESAIIQQGTTDILHYDETNHTLTWQGKLNQGNMQLVPVAPWGNTTLASLGVDAIGCSEGCQYFNTYIGFDFIYNGQAYQDLTISDNGFVMPGNTNFSFWSALFNQSFPNERPINNVIAPLWAEFDLADSANPDDLGGGELRVAVRVIDGRNYLVIEWLDVKQQPDEFEQGNSENSYSFQLIIEENSDNIWFNYLELSALPPFATIGAENYDGRIGVTHYFDGEGAGLPLPISNEGYTLKLVYQPEGRVDINYQVELSNNQNFTQADNVSTEEEISISVNVLANDEQQNHVTALAKLTTSNQTYNAYRNLPVAITGNIEHTTLALVASPEHGTAVVNDNGHISYQPSADFFGRDIFSYKVADQAGHFSQPTQVTITVDNVNDLPVINHVDADNAIANQKVTIIADAVDADDDMLSFQWQQTKGPIVQLTQLDNKIEFTAPYVYNTTQISFSVVANDGAGFSESKSVDLTINRPQSKNGGALLYLIIVLSVLLTLKLIFNINGKRQY